MQSEKRRSSTKGGTIPKSDSTSSATTAEPTTPGEKQVSKSFDDSASTSMTEPLIPKGSKSGGGRTSTSSDEEPPSKDAILSRQVFLSLIIVFTSVAPGMTMGFSGITLDQLPLTISQSTWFASIVAIAAPIGCLLSGPILDKFGRKPALILISLVGLLGWLMICYSLTITNLFIGRFLTGLTVGLAATPSVIYIAESIIANNLKLRASLATWPCVALAFGILNVYFMGALLRFRKVAGLAAIFSGLSALLILWLIPESPAWLNSKGRRGDAEWAARKLRLGPPSTQTEPTSRGDTETGEGEKMSTSNVFKEFLKPEAYKPLLILTMFFFFQQFSAVHVVIFYMTDFIRSSGFYILNPYFISVIAGLIIFFSTISISFILPNTGVKALTAVSGIGIALSMFVIGIYKLFEKAPVVNFEWGFFNLIPLAALCLNIVASSVGFLPIPFALVGEIFPIQVKGVAAGITTCLAYFFSFLAIKTYPYLHIALGSGIFFFYGLVAAIGTGLILVFLPETKGKTLQEILQGFTA